MTRGLVHYKSFFYSLFDLISRTHWLVLASATTDVENIGLLHFAIKEFGDTLRCAIGCTQECGIWGRGIARCNTLDPMAKKPRDRQLGVIQFRCCAREPMAKTVQRDALHAGALVQHDRFGKLQRALTDIIE